MESVGEQSQCGLTGAIQAIDKSQMDFAFLAEAGSGEDFGSLIQQSNSEPPVEEAPKRRSSPGCRRPKSTRIFSRGKLEHHVRAGQAFNERTDAAYEKKHTVVMAAALQKIL